MDMDSVALRNFCNFVSLPHIFRIFDFPEAECEDLIWGQSQIFEISVMSSAHVSRFFDVYVYVKDVYKYLGLGTPS